MTAEQALQILNNATENLPATRVQHQQITQALMTLQSLVQQTKAAMEAQKKAAEQTALDRVVTQMTKPEKKKD